MASQNIARLGVVFALNSAEFSASVDKAISENNRLKTAVQRDSKSAQKLSQELQYQLEDYGKTVSKVTQMERLFNAETGKYRNAAPEIKARILEQARALDQLAESGRKAAMQQMKAMGGLSPQQQAQIGYQLTDIFTSLAGGQNPIMVMIQQGGQLRDVFGGFGNALKAIVNTIGAVRLAFAGVAGVLGVFAYAAYRGAEDMARLRDDLILAGNIAGKTQGQFLELGSTIGDRFSITIKTARDLVGALAASGKFTETSFEAAAKVIGKFAELAGVSGKEAAQKLIPLLDGSASSARQLNSQFNFLTLAQYKQIEALEKYGKTQESIKLQAEALEKAFSKQERNLGTLETAWKNLQQAASKAWDAMLGIGREDPNKRINVIQQEIAALDAAIADMIAKKFARIPGGPLAGLEDRRAALAEEIKFIRRSEQLKADAVADAAKKQEAENKAIADRVATGGREGEIARRVELEKAKLDAIRSVIIKSADETANIQIEYEQKVQDAVLKMREKNEKEAYRLSFHNAQLLQQEVIKLYNERDHKVRDIEAKRAIERGEEARKIAEETDQYLSKIQQSRDALISANQANFEQRKSEFQIEQGVYEFRKNNVLATQKELELNRLRLDIQRQIADLEKNELYLGPAGEQAKQFEIERIIRMGSMREALINYQEEMRKMEAMTDAVWGNMSRAIDNFVRTGKLSFKDLARSIIQDLIRIQLQSQMTTIFKTFVGSIFGGGMRGTGMNSVGATGGYNSLAPFADGGAISQGQPALVGERGPEVFVPRSAGTIVPNHALGGSGVTNVTNNYINAIDVKSFEDRLLGSSNTIWAANQYAQKSLATGRGRT